MSRQLTIEIGAIRGRTLKVLICILAVVAGLVVHGRADAAPPTKPNFIIFLVDDVGYGDIGCFGGTRARSPNLDRMATQGVKLTDFYVHPVCGVTRAALMTGSYAMRIGEPGNQKAPHPIMHPKEITIAEVLRDAGYRTGMIGKWHLAGGRREAYPPELMPNAQGFDDFFGAPLHNGTTRTVRQSPFRMQLMRQNKVIDQAIDQKEMDAVTRRFTEEAIQFINANKERPFLLYVAHSMAHVVLGATDRFRGQSGGGLYGDVIAELDWSAGAIVDALRKAGIDKNTLFIFTSDNGPWVEKHLAGEGGKDAHYGTAKPLRGYKMTTWEGGVRVPTIAYWPGRTRPGAVCREPATIMDLLPTFAALGDAKLPADRTLDGRDITPLLLGDTNAKSPHEAIYHYAYTHLQAVRSGDWKLVRPRPAKPRWTSWSARMIDGVTDFELYNLRDDIGETKNVAAEHPEVVARLKALIEKGRRDIGDFNLIGKDARFYDDGPKRPDARRWQNRPAAGAGHEGSAANPVAPPNAEPFEPLGKLHWDFESGDAQGFVIVDGNLGPIVSGHASLPNWKAKPFRRQGKHHLSTVRLNAKGQTSDKPTGAIESPVFQLNGTKMAFLIGGGKSKQTRVALCQLDGTELMTASGAQGPTMRRVVWDVAKYKGQKLLLHLIDQSETGWGHLTFDDFSCDGEIDMAATKRRRQAKDE